MKHSKRPCKYICTVIAILALQSSGCSGPREDVRVTLCKRLAETLLNGQEPMEWGDPVNEFKEPEFAVTSLRLEGQAGNLAPGSIQASCYYDYDIVEQNAMTHADPFSAYASQPYRMTLNKETVPEAELYKAMNAVLRQQGKKIVERLDQGIEKAANTLESGLNR
jgi:hypothetical protein